MTTKKTLKDILDELESIIKKMEGEDLELENMIALYEKGSKLSTECKKIIEKSESKINIIQSKIDKK